MKILFSSRLLNGVSGGVERMLVAIMNDLVRRGHEIELLSWDFETATSFYPMDKGIIWHRLNIGDARRKASLLTILNRFRAIRKIVRASRPDVIIGFQQGPFIATALALLGLNIPVVAAERNAPQRFDHTTSGKTRWREFQSFRLARKVTVQFESYRDLYPAYLHNRIVTIANPVPFPAEAAIPGDDTKSVKNILCVARLSYQKNIGVLIDAFESVAAKMPDWNLVLVGDGEDRAKLEARVKQAGLESRVRFAGAVSNVAHFYKESDLFCLPSRWEGFPNALAEAMSFGLPSVGYVGCAGVNELIHTGETGLLADGNGDPARLADALLALMKDSGQRKAMGLAARQFIKQFSPSAIFEEWEDFFSALCAEK